MSCMWRFNLYFQLLVLYPKRRHITSILVQYKTRGIGHQFDAIMQLKFWKKGSSFHIKMVEPKVYCDG